MKSIIVTFDENADIDELLNAIESLNGVKKVEKETMFSIPGNVLEEQDYINIVAEAETDEYLSANEVFSNLKLKFSK
jgi:7,8-dihydro-6-hydroxymethylpterin-pyrophosphokinase